MRKVALLVCSLDRFAWTLQVSKAKARAASPFGLPGEVSDLMATDLSSTTKRPPAAPLSMKPGAIRARRFRQRRRDKIASGDLVPEKGPITSYACPCGYRLRIAGTFKDTVAKFAQHMPCLFFGGTGSEITQVNLMAGRPRNVPRPPA